MERARMDRGEKLQYVTLLLHTLSDEALDKHIHNVEKDCVDLEKEKEDATAIMKVKEDMNKRLAKRRGLC